MISSVFNSGGITPPLDGQTPVFMPVGADPSVAPGLNLPPGSIALRGGTVYYWKVDTGPTDWVTTPFSGGGGGGGITNVTGSDGVTVTTPVAGVKNATNDLVTGVDVAQLNVDSLGAATIDAVAGIALTSSGATSDITATSARKIALTATTDITAAATAAISLVAAGAAGALLRATHAGGGGHTTVESDHGTVFIVADAGPISLTALGATSDITATSGRDINLTAGDDFTVAATASVSIVAAGAGGALLRATHAGGGGNATLESDHGTVFVVADAGAVSITATAGSITQVAGGTGGILLDTKGDGVVAADSIVLNSDEDFTVHADDDVAIAANDGVTLGAGGSMLLDVLGATLTLSTQGGTGDIDLASGDDVHITAADGIGVIATNLLTLGGAAAAMNVGGPLSFTTLDIVTFTTNDHDFVVDAGAGDLVFGGATLSFFGGGGNGQATHLNDITGGTVQDAESRIAIDFIKAKLVGWGLMEA